MASSSSSVAVVTTLDYTSNDSSNQPQYRILDRMSTLFGVKKKNNHGGASSSSSSGVVLQASLNENDNETLVASQIDSVFNDDRNTSCVDSMYSSLQSRSSRYRPVSNQDTPQPLRTVQLMDPIVHLPTPTPPSPPPVPAADPPSTSPAPSTVRKSTPPPGTSSQKIEDVEAQFKLLLEEYAPSADHISNVNNLTFAQKEMLLLSSRSPALVRKNSTFSHVMPSFSLKATFGMKKPKHHKTNISQDPQFFSTPSHTDQGTLSHMPGIPTRSTVQNNQETYGRSTSRSKLKSTPEYFVHLLCETHVRELDDAEVLDLRVFLRSVVVSWTSEFLAQGGYEAIANLFKQMKEAPKRFPNDNRMLQHLGKCLKTIMTHQSMGTQIVLTNPSALFHIRDILFGPASKKQKQVYGLDITTRSLLLNLLCTLATLQTRRTEDTEYVHGYDVLRRLLLDRPSDKLYEEEDKKNQPKHVSPFPISLKTDPKEILQMIMEKDPNGEAIGQEYKWDSDELKPRYTSWMRELQYTVERHIETITFLAQVLNYDFKSAYRQIKQKQNLTGQEAATASNSDSQGSVTTEEGVVDYIITHLRLIRTVVTTQPTTYTGYYDEREQEKMRRELMLSGFDKTSKILIQCPHPTVRSSYINYLKPLMSPCADLSIPKETTEDDASQPPPLPSRRSMDSYADLYDDPDLENEDDDNQSYDNYELSVYANDNHNESSSDYQEGNYDSHILGERQWSYEQNPYYDDIFQGDEFIEDHFNSDENSSDISASNVSYHQNDNDSMYDEDKSVYQTCKPVTTRVINLIDNSNNHS